jgi:hypothetical protein
MTVIPPPSDDQPEQDPSTVAYRAWMSHVKFNDAGKQCDVCAEAPMGNPQLGCEDGKRLWAGYRFARIAKALPVTDGS